MENIYLNDVDNIYFIEIKLKYSGKATITKHILSEKKRWSGAYPGTYEDEAC